MRWVMFLALLGALSATATASAVPSNTATVTMEFKVGPCLSLLKCTRATVPDCGPTFRCKPQFKSSCYDAPAGIVSFSEGLADNPITARTHSESAHITILDFTISLNGTHAVTAPAGAGAGRGRWTATGVPSACGGSKAASSGTYTSAWVPTARGVTVTFTLRGFPHT